VALAEPTVVVPNVNDVGLADRVAELDCAPVPERVTWSELLVALLDTVSVPLIVPVVLGRNVTVAVHDPPAANDVPQVLVCEKSAVVVTAEIDALAVPELLIVTVLVALDEPTTVDAKSSDVGLAARVAVGVEPAVYTSSCEI
jgi:hypothetical protein